MFAFCCKIGSKKEPRDHGGWGNFLYCLYLCLFSGFFKNIPPKYGLKYSVITFINPIIYISQVIMKAGMGLMKFYNLTIKFQTFSGKDSVIIRWNMKIYSLIIRFQIFIEILSLCVFHKCFSIFSFPNPLVKTERLEGVEIRHFPYSIKVTF